MMRLPARLAFVGLRARLVLWDSRQQLQDTYIVTYGQQCRRIVSLLMDRPGAQNIYGVALFKSPWPMHPSLSMLSSSQRERSDGGIWYLSRSYTNINASGEPQGLEQLWKDYFADPSQWWDNRVDKRNPKSPDFKHKITKNALWIDGWSTPPWVKARLKMVEDKLQHQAPAQLNRLPTNNNGKGDSWSISSRELGQIAQGDDANLHMQSASARSEAFVVLKNRVQQGTTADSYMYVDILQQCFEENDLMLTKQVHNCIKENRMEQNICVANNLVRIYIRCGRLQDARQVFDKLVKKSVISWTIMIGGYVEHDHAKDAMEVFNQMLQEGAQPNEITYLNILKACASPTTLNWGKEVHAHIKHNSDLELNVRLGTALVHMYAKSASVDDAQLVFDRMEDRDLITWNVMIGGLAQHGREQDALQLFENMKTEGVKPDGCSFVAILSACSHAGLVDEGRRQFLAMVQDYGIEPTVEHYTCMVDLLGRAGHLEEVKLFIHNMPLEPNSATWGALLGACRTYVNVELAELATKELLMLEPNDVSTYVLLSNIYAAAGKWDQVSMLCSVMQGRGICKEPEHGWIEVDNKDHRSFVIGDSSHSEAKEVYMESKRLFEKSKAEGYILDTQLALCNIDEEDKECNINEEDKECNIDEEDKGCNIDEEDKECNIDEEDKELALCSHSEKLAIVYGLMHIPHGKPIRIYNNLRMCLDCHTTTKSISKVTGRDIVARDASRFHHFKDGVCSCGDKW